MKLGLWLTHIKDITHFIVRHKTHS